MTDYAGLSRDELIERLRQLEATISSHEMQTAQRTSLLQREQAALRDREARLQAVLDTAVEGIITIDERGMIESFNQAAEAIFGYQAGEITGRNVSVLMPAPYRHEHDGYLANYMKTGEARIIGIGREVLGQRKDGSTFPMDLSVSEVRLEGKRLFAGFVRDITERKRLQKEVLEISDRERRTIGQGLHDGLCQQLAGIELMSQVLEQNLAKASKSDADQAGKIGRHVREAISQTRKLASGLSPVSLESDGLLSAFHELAGTVQELFHVRCRLEFDESILVKDNDIATHLYRIGQEAASNAIKHGKAKNIVISFQREAGKICLRVSDDGGGFPKGASRNSGMGLQIMKYRAGMIGGGLEIRSGPGKGAVVECLI